MGEKWSNCEYSMMHEHTGLVVKRDFSKQVFPYIMLNSCHVFRWQLVNTGLVILDGWLAMIWNGEVSQFSTITMDKELLKGDSVTTVVNANVNEDQVTVIIPQIC